MGIFSPNNNVPLKTVALFAVFGILWILAGEFIVADFDIARISTVQVYKGILFVCLTATLIYGLVYFQTKQLAASESAYRGLFVSNPLPIYIYDPDTLQVLEVNEAACAFFGYDRERFNQLKITDLFLEEDREKLFEKLKSDKKTFLQSGIWKVRTSTGDMRMVNVQSYEKKKERQRIRLVVSYDLTETLNSQKRLEDANYHLKMANDRLANQERELRALNNQFTLASQSAGIGMLEWRPYSQTFEWDQHMCTLLHDPQPAGIRSWSTFKQRIFPADLVPVVEIFEAPRTNERIDLQFRIQAGDQPMRWLQISAAWFADRQDEPYLIGAAWDISQLKGQQTELALSKSKIDALINSTDDLVWSLDKDLKLLSYNEPFFREVLSRDPHALEAPVDAAHLPGQIHSIVYNWKSYIDRALAGESIIFEDHTPDSKTGSIKVQQIKFHPILGPHGEVMGISCFSRDISQMVAQEEQIRKQNQTISEIAWKFAHMLRVPVANSIGLIENFSTSEIHDPFSVQAFANLKILQDSLDAMIKEMSLQLEAIMPDYARSGGQGSSSNGTKPGHSHNP